MLDMRWTGWVVLAIASGAIWILSLTMLNASFGRLHNDGLLAIGGCAIIIVVCIATPVIRSIIRKGQSQ